MNDTTNKDYALNVFCNLCDCYGENKPFDIKNFSQKEHDSFKEMFDLEKDDSLFNNPSRKTIFDFLYEAVDNLEDDYLLAVCSTKNLSLVLSPATGLLHQPALNFILNNKEKFEEFIRYTIDKDGFVKNTEVLPIKDLKFKDLEFVFQPHFESWEQTSSVNAGAVLVDMCDCFGLKIDFLDKSPKDWDIEECEFEEIAEYNKDNLKKFARLFSKPINEWYGKKWCDSL